MTDEVGALRTERDSAVAAVMALGTELDKVRFSREVLRADLKRARARIAELETSLRLATEAAEALKVYTGVAEARITGLGAT